MHLDALDGGVHKLLDILCVFISACAYDVTFLQKPGMSIFAIFYFLT